MPPFLYRCPNTGNNVQAWAADDPEDDDLTYVQLTCLACAQAHLINPRTGKVDLPTMTQVTGSYVSSSSVNLFGG